MHPRGQMIKRLYVDNYKCFVNFEVGLDPLTLLLGRNGAGKSAILDIVFAMQALLRGTAKVTDAFVFPMETLTRWQSRDIQAFEIEVEKVGRDTKALMMAFREGGAPYELRMDEASDGQRALSALYALTCFATGNGYTLLIDEPENYVALSEIRPWLRTVEELCGTSLHQVVMCSHHPEYIDYIGIKSGVLMMRENSGPARAGKIAKEIRNGLSENTALRLSELVADRALKNWSGCVAATS